MKESMSLKYKPSWYRYASYLLGNQGEDTKEGVVLAEPSYLPS